VVERVTESIERVVPPLMLSVILVMGFLVAGPARAADPIDLVTPSSTECLCIGTGSLAVSFGHGARHLPSTLSAPTVQSQITNHVRTNYIRPVGTYWNGWVYSRGSNGRLYLIQYGAYRVALTQVHVGTYYVIQ